MIIAELDENLIAQIRSSSSIDSVTQCVTELVLNSLDAKSTSIAVRVNLNTFRIQVVDNGKGISRSNLENVGIRYMTNKCHSLADLKKHLKYYGFKGEALANISKISQKVTVTTREENSEETYEKIIDNTPKIEATKSRASWGTTVTVDGFLNNLPVRQQCVKTNELDNIKRSVESLIIIHPRVSFTLRNDLGAKLILSSIKCPDIASSFKTIHTDINVEDFTFIKVSKNKINVEGLIHKEFHENKRLQYIYVNKRFIVCSKVQNLLNAVLRKSNKGDEKKKFPVFVVHIKCPYSHIDINLEPSKTVVFFKKFETVKRCLEKMLSTFLGGNLPKEVKRNRRQKKATSEFGVSQIGGAVKGFAIKRKNEELEEVSNRSEKIIDDTPVCEEPKIPTKQTKMALPIVIRKNDKKELENPCNNTLFTNFPENEQRGKDVIMDKFIMSLQTFPAETRENISDQSLPTRNEGSASSILPPNKKSFGVQTSPSLEGLGKVSVAVQTRSMLEPDFTLFPRKSLQKYVSDYDFDFSRVEALPTFNFNKCDTTLPVFLNLDQTKKLFDFRNKDVVNILPNFEQPLEDFKKSYLQADMSVEDFTTNSVNQNPSRVFTSKLGVIQSPYFTKKVKNRPSPMKPPQDVILCTCHNRLSKCCEDMESTTTKNFDQVKMTFMRQGNAKKRLNESSISKYFTPKRPKVFRKHPTPFVKPHSPEIKQSVLFEQSKDLFAFSNSSEDRYESQLIITMEEGKENISTENRFSGNFIAPTLTLNDTLKPKPKDISFEMMERIDFVPKGLSPILKNYGKVDNMSPQSKEQLQNAIIESYDNELLLIKWQSCLIDKDPRRFFEEMYLEKSKLIETSIPNIHKSGYLKHAFKGFENMSFSKSLFQNLEVIGQLDCKFIVAMEKTKKIIMLFDQHAVHERVRLEELSESYKNASTKLDQTITIFIPQTDLCLLQRQKSTLKLLGLNLDFFANGITVFGVPLCIFNKSKKGVNIVILTEALIQEIIETIKINNGVIVSTPKVIQNIVNSEACRGAIKFGDSLTKNECIMHLKRVADCKLPFQCAHGRPTLTPLINLNKSYEEVNPRPRLINLKY